MNQKQIGIIVIVIGILVASLVFIVKFREDKLIMEFIKEKGTCYLSDSTCLHEDRDYTAYIIGWVLAGTLFALGIYLVIFDKTQKILAEHQVLVTSALKEAKDKDEFNAFLAGFNEDERLVLKAIKEQDGILQSTLRYRTGLSKTALSLILKSFEEKKIITKEESGKTNKVYLRNKF